MNSNDMQALMVRRLMQGESHEKIHQSLLESFPNQSLELAKIISDLASLDQWRRTLVACYVAMAMNIIGFLVLLGFGFGWWGVGKNLGQFMTLWAIPAHLALAWLLTRKSASLYIMAAVSSGVCLLLGLIELSAVGADPASMAYALMAAIAIGLDLYLYFKTGATYKVLGMERLEREDGTIWNRTHVLVRSK